MKVNRGRTLIWLLCCVASILPELFAVPEQGKGIDFGVLKLSLDTNNGLALEKEVAIDTPLLKVHRKSKIGFGEPMVKYSDESDSDSDEGRSKRAIVESENVIPLRSGRKKRTPCYGTYPAQMPGGGGAGGDETIDEAERRRARRKRKSSSKGRKKKVGRRRRDTEVADSADKAKNAGKKFAERMSEVGQSFDKIVGTVVNTTQQVVEAVVEGIKDIVGGSGAGQKVPTTA